MRVPFIITNKVSNHNVNKRFIAQPRQLQWL